MDGPHTLAAAEVSDWREFIRTEDDEDLLRRLRRHARTGRPLGSPDFVTDLEQRLTRLLTPRKPGPNPGAES